MKTEIKFEGSLTRKDNITSITANRNRKEKSFKERNVQIILAQPTAQTEPKKVLWIFLVHDFLLFCTLHFFVCGN